MQGNFELAFLGKKENITKVEDAFQELFDNSEGYLDIVKTKNFDTLPGDGQAGLLISTNTSINVNFGVNCFDQLVERVPEVEAGLWWTTLDTEAYFRTFSYSKAGSAKRKEWNDTIKSGEYTRILLARGRDEPAVKQILELYHKVPYQDDCTRAEPGNNAWKNWDYKKLTRTFTYRGKSYNYDDGKVRGTWDPCLMFDELDYEELGCEYGDDSALYDKFEDPDKEGCLYWETGDSSKYWSIPDYMRNLFTLNGTHRSAFEILCVQRPSAPPIQHPTVTLNALNFQGKRFVLTGQFQNAPYDRDQVKAKIEARGGKCTGSISGKTDYLVLGGLGEVGRRKVEKAQEQQKKGSPIQIISEDTLFQFLS